MDHTTPFDHEHPHQGGHTTSRGLTPYCRNHHRIKHSGLWDESRDDNGDLILTSPVGLFYRTPAAGLLHLLGITLDQVADPEKSRKAQGAQKPRRRRHTRQENKAAAVRAERKRQHTHRLRGNAERAAARAQRDKERIAQYLTESGASPHDPAPF